MALSAMTVECELFIYLFIYTHPTYKSTPLTILILNHMVSLHLMFLIIVTSCIKSLLTKKPTPSSPRLPLIHSLDLPNHL